jgi:hypothetical protein
VALVQRGLAVTLLPALPLRDVGGLDRHPIGTERAIFAATRTADAARPSTQAVLQAVRGLLRTTRSAG